MPLLDNQDDALEVFKTPNAFAFSGQRIADLGASEFTICSLIVDQSGSVGGFKTELERCMSESAKALRKSPRADNLMIRTTAFNSSLREIHGFKTLTNVNPGDYTSCLKPSGSTALFDAVSEGVSSMLAYAKEMVKQDFSVNGILIVLTDGDDNMSSNTVTSCRQLLESAVKGEVLESLVSILVGVNVSDPSMKNILDRFHKDAGFSQFQAVEQADSKSLARLANFISKSVSAQSQALGTGSGSKSLVF